MNKKTRHENVTGPISIHSLFVVVIAVVIIVVDYSFICVFGLHIERI